MRREYEGTPAGVFHGEVSSAAGRADAKVGVTDDIALSWADADASDADASEGATCSPNGWRRVS